MKILSGAKGDGIWWFRIFGYGIHWKNTTKHPLLFSERYELWKGINININWRIGFLSRKGRV